MTILLLDVFVALGGEVDRAIGSLGLLAVLWWLRRRESATPPAAVVPVG